MNYSLFLTKLILCCALAGVVLSSCGQSGSVSGHAPTIPQGSETITFQITGETDVIFSHKKHAETYLDNDCLVCHLHTNIRDTTIWDCNQCHTPEDNEEFCPDDPEGHACWMKQCEQCHQQLSVDPTPDCFDCHS